MHKPKKKPDLARVSGSIANNSTDRNFPSPASIRRRYGTGWAGYEAAKSAWHAANPSADPCQIEQAMRHISRAIKV